MLADDAPLPESRSFSAVFSQLYKVGELILSHYEDVLVDYCGLLTPPRPTIGQTIAPVVYDARRYTTHPHGMLLTPVPEKQFAWGISLGSNTFANSRSKSWHQFLEKHGPASFNFVLSSTLGNARSWLRSAMSFDGKQRWTYSELSRRQTYDLARIVSRTALSDTVQHHLNQKSQLRQAARERAKNFASSGNAIALSRTQTPPGGMGREDIEHFVGRGYDEKLLALAKSLTSIGILGQPVPLPTDVKATVDPSAGPSAQANCQ